MTISEAKFETAAGQPCAFERSIWSWANAYKISFSIFSLNELGVFGLIAQDFKTAGRIAAELGLDEELLLPLLELVASVGVLQQNGPAFRAPEGIETLLPLLVMESRLSASHVTSANIAQVVRTGKAADIFQSPNVAEYIPVFTAAMRSSARTLAPYLLRFGNIRQCRRVLDLGGADGSLALALRHLAPHLSIDVVDLPRMQGAFEKNINDHGAGAAVRFHAADLRRPETLRGLLDGADAIIISNVIHLLTTKQRMELYRAVRQHGPAGASFLVYDQFIDQAAPLNATDCMAVDWVINGVQFRETPQQLCQILEGCGLHNAQHRSFRGLPGAVVAARL
jgi:O-methyltransferase domain